MAPENETQPRVDSNTVIADIKASYEAASRSNRFNNFFDRLQYLDHEGLTSDPKIAKEIGKFSKMPEVNEALRCSLRQNDFNRDSRKVLDNLEVCEILGSRNNPKFQAVVDKLRVIHQEAIAEKQAEEVRRAEAERRRREQEAADARRREEERRRQEARQREEERLRREAAARAEAERIRREREAAEARRREQEEADRKNAEERKRKEDEAKKNAGTNTGNAQGSTEAPKNGNGRTDPEAEAKRKRHEEKVRREEEENRRIWDKAQTYLGNQWRSVAAGIPQNPDVRLTVALGLVQKFIRSESFRSEYNENTVAIRAGLEVLLPEVWAQLRTAGASISNRDLEIISNTIDRLNKQPSSQTYGGQTISRFGQTLYVSETNRGLPILTLRQMDEARKIYRKYSNALHPDHHFNHGDPKLKVVFNELIKKVNSSFEPFK